VVDWTYDPASEDGPRTIPVHVWYPTEATSGDPVLHLDIFEDAEALGNAPAAPPAHADGYPVFAHSHGFQGYGGTSAFLMAHLATHGFVAVAPDHVDNLLTDHSDPLPTAHYIHRPQDIQQSLDALEQGAFAEVGLEAGAADTSRVVMSGHSFGVYTTWMTSGATIQPELLAEACSGGPGFKTGTCTPAEEAAFLDGSLDEPRIVGSIPMAGGFRRELLGTEGPSTVHGPWLLLTGSNDDVGAADGFATTSGMDLRWAELEGGCHQTFALGLCDTLDPALGYELVETLSLAFVRAVLLDDQSEETTGILDGSTSISDAVTIQHRTD
jgi:predicted dienelactone hydrolase